MSEKQERIWYSGIISFLINLLFGVGVSYIAGSIVVFVMDLFPSTPEGNREIVIFWIISILLLGCFCTLYNFSRYLSMKEKRLSYGKAGFCFTLILPLLLPTLLMVVVCFYQVVFVFRGM